MDMIILASSSPRRQEILKQLDIPFKVMIPDVDETPPECVSLEDVPEYLAARKAGAIVKHLQATQEVTWVLGADTLVILKGKIYGKPKNKEEAIEFLHELQGKTHCVVSSLALFNGKLFYLSTRKCISHVTFKEMSDNDINDYIETGEWYGVAGAYRIQEKGACFIKKIEGSPSGIAGLPIFELYDMLQEQGFNLFQK